MNPQEQENTMSKASLIIALTAAIGLGACTNDADQAARNANLVPLLDNTGTAVMFVPISATRGAPVGTPVTVNRNGQMQTLTLGERQGGTTAGNITIVGSGGDGAPVIERIGGSGDISRPGAAVVTGNLGGTPETTMVDPASLPTSRAQRERAARRAARAAAAPAPAAQ
jgi:hypothetical protein